MDLKISLSFNKTKENYSSLDGLRAYAAIGIVMCMCN